MMKDGAEEERVLERTIENWVKEFGEDGHVETPLGSIKLSDRQFNKSGREDRSMRFGLIKPTLANPDVILEKYAPKENADRDTKFLFIKSFVKANGERIINFESITVKQGEEEVSISNHEIEPSKVKKELRENKMLWNRFSDGSNSLGENQGLAITQSEQDPNKTDSGLNPHSDSKNSKSSSNNQVNDKENSSGSSKGRHPRTPLSAEDDRAYLDAVERGDEKKARDMVDKALNNYLKNHSYTRDDVKKLFGNILEANRDDFEIFGIRYDDRMLVPEEVFPKSHQLFQEYMEGEETGEQLYPEGEGYYSGYYDAGELDGTSTIYVKSADDIASALGESYTGKYVYLVAGENKGEGLDEGEYLIGNAKVLGVMSMPKTAGHEYNNMYHELFTNKSIDTVTRDDNGNIIPLSERFNPERDDIRFSADEDNGDNGLLGYEVDLTKALLDLAQRNRDNVSVRLQAMRAIGGNLSKLRQAMAKQRVYDRKTVDSIVRLANTIIGSGTVSLRC